MIALALGFLTFGSFQEGAAAGEKTALEPQTAAEDTLTEQPIEQPVVQEPSLWERLEFYATGRMRGEATWDQPADADDRYRGRMRFRVGGRYLITEGLKAEARLSTASEGNDANNPHWDFGDGDGFNGTEVAIDRFFLTWLPAEEWDVSAGKQPHAFEKPPIYSDFLWDEDVQPSGVAALWKPASGGDATFDVRAAGYVATEVADDADPKMLGMQGNLRVPLEDDLSVSASAAVYDWDDLEDGVAVAGNQGNTDVTGGFTILEGLLATTMQRGPLDEATAFLQLMHNLADDDGEDNGFSIGAQLGPAWQRAEQGDYNVFLVYYDLDANAVFSPVAQDDTPIAGTGDNTDPEGMKGVVFGGSYFWRKNVAFKLWVLTSDAGVDEDPIRIRIDLDFTVP